MVTDKIWTGLYAMRSQKPHSSLPLAVMIGESIVVGDLASRLSVDGSTKVSVSEMTDSDRRCPISLKESDFEERR